MRRARGAGHRVSIHWEATAELDIKAPSLLAGTGERNPNARRPSFLVPLSYILWIQWILSVKVASKADFDEC